MVQSTGVNALMAMVAAPPVAASNASNATSLASADEGDFSQQFSQLLSDSGKQFGDQPTGQQGLQDKLGKAAGLGALAAQEVPDNTTDLQAQLLQARDQVISASDANELIKRVDKILAQDRAPVSAQALNQIREQLLRIARTGETKTIGDVLQAAPAVKESKLSQLGLTALLSARKVEGVKQPVTEEEQSPTLAETHAVSATIFRPHSPDDDAPKAASSDTETQKPDTVDASTVSVIMPLAATSFVPVLPVAQNDNTVSALHPRADLDALIPPLTSPKQEAEALPEVNLPKWSAEANARKSENSGLFQSLAAASGHEGAKQADALANSVANDKTPDGVTAVNNPSHSNGFSPTQTVSAAQPVNVVPTHGYINHAPVTEQVHVAVRKAASDGIERMTVQLDPIELGRVEVNIQTNREGQTQISFIVDKPETFDNLSRDARTLERSLQEAGIKTDAGSMQFNLRQQPQQQQLHSDMGQGQHQPQQQAAVEEPSAVRGSVTAMDAATRNYIFNVREGVDISA